MKARWNRLSPQQKLLRGSQILLSLIVLIAASTQLLGIWKNANMLAIPAMAFVLLLQSVADWKVNRITSLLGLFAAIAVFTMFGIGIYLK